MRYYILAILTMVVPVASAQWLNTNTGEWIHNRPTRIGATHNPTDADLRSAGIVPATIVTTKTTVTNVIPPTIQQVAANYKASFESIFGEGSVTNRDYTESVVAITLSLNPNVSAETGVRLQTWFKILNDFWGRGEVWTFPYGASEYVTTNTATKWIEVE